MKNKLLFIILIILFSSCVINKRIYYEYSTGLPGYTIPEYDSINKSIYYDYFLNEVYMTITVSGRYYSSEEERIRAPYHIMFLAVSKNKKYKIMKINNCIINSSINGEYSFDCLPDEFIFGQGTKYKNDIFYFTPQDIYPIDLDIKANEIIEIQFELVLEDEEEKEYKKQMKYTVKPDIKTKYIETVFDWW